jgi:ribosome-associated heat shock protein Hsp15
MRSQRLDKWLWCARLVKTRTGAARLVEAGKVRLNGARVAKPSRLVQPGDVVTATPAGRLFVARVVSIAERRWPASQALSLYEDLTPKAPLKPDPGLNGGPQNGPRPTKRDRRRIDALRGGA